MTKYFAGYSLGEFIRTSASITVSTSAGGTRFDDNYVPCCFLCPSGSNAQYIESTPFSASPTSFWVRFDYSWATSLLATGIIVHLLKSGDNVFRIIGSGSVGSVKAQYWNGSSWIDTGSAVSLSSTLKTIVVRVDLNSGFEMFYDGVSVASGSGWSGGGTTVTHIRLHGAATSSGSAYISQVMAADYDLRDSHLLVSEINGNSSANTGAASGGYTDVNEIGADDSTAISITTPGNKAGQTHAGITLPSGNVIAAMIVSARGRVDGVITDGKLGVRSGGSNYSSSGLSYSGGYEPRQHIIETDPATGVKFTQSGFNSAEPYLEAV
jgi:hypothetical protein